MARTEIPVNILPREGSSLSTVSADVGNGNFFHMPSSGMVLLSFFNAAGGTATIYTNETMDSLSLPNRVLTLPAATVFLWMLEGPPYVQADSTVWVDVSGDTSVAVYNCY